MKRYLSIKTYRITVACFFFAQGLVFSSWASRIPDIKRALSLSDAQLGGVLFCIPIGQLIAMALSAYLVNRYGSKKMLGFAAVIYPLLLVLLGASYSLTELCVALVLFGMAANLSNIAVNTQGVGVEKLYGRSIMSSFHGIWSLAGFTGGLISTMMTAIGTTPFYHFCVIFMLILLMVITMHGKLIPRDVSRKESRMIRAGRNVHYISPKEGSRQGLSRFFFVPERSILLLGVISFCCMMCEGTMFEWSSVYFEQVIDPPRSLIRLGFIASMCSMAGGRFAADGIVRKLGVVKVISYSGVLISAGLLTAVIFPYIATATIGFLLVGLGVAPIIPTCYSLAGRSKTMKPGTALAAVSTIGFFGFLIGPPIIGFLAQALNLRWSLGLIAVMGLITVFLAPRLKLFQDER